MTLRSFAGFELLFCRDEVAVITRSDPVLYVVVLNWGGGGFGPQGAFGDVWSHFWLSQLEGGGAWHPVVEGRDAADLQCAGLAPQQRTMEPKYQVASRAKQAPCSPIAPVTPLSLHLQKL